jgi:chitinase
MAGVPAKKIVVGMPLYGRSFADTDGPGTPFAESMKGTWEPGIYDYRDLPPLGAQLTVDFDAAASWSYDHSQRLMVSFDIPEVTTTKAAYIRSQGLGGAMWWESSGDKTGNKSLVSAVSTKLCPVATQGN